MKNNIHGATLVELIITIVIIGAAMAGVAGAFATLVGRSADPLDQSRAVALAQLYMDEILSKPFDHDAPPGGEPVYSGTCNIGSESGETRATFNDVDDYHGISQAQPASPMGLLDGYSGFRVSVIITCLTAPEMQNLGLTNGDDVVKLIELTILTPSAQTYLFSAYRVNF